MAPHGTVSMKTSERNITAASRLSLSMLKKRGIAVPPRILATLLLCGNGCSSPVAPSAIVGDWSGRDVPAHFAYIQIRFERHGSGVSCTACRFDGVDLGFSGVPVHVDGSRVTFTAYPEEPNAHTFIGRFTSDGETLNGAWTRSPSEEIVLERGGNLCANAH
jgi:hypothetical protein